MSIEEDLYSTFSNVASALGYSDVHGRIIGVLLVEEKLSLQKLASKTGYSTSQISLSLDLLELVGMVKKIKKKGDRKLYVKIEGDLLEGLKTAILIKLKKNTDNALESFDEYHEDIEKTEGKRKKKLNNAIHTLKKEVTRLSDYVDKLSEVNLPD